MNPEAQAPRRLWRAAGNVAVAYRRWVTAEEGIWLSRDSDSEKNLRDLVDSIHYRYEAVCFHRRLLEQAYSDASADPESFDMSLHRGALRSLCIQLQYLFDDLVFNCMSLFDYVGCLAGLALEGNRSRSIKWSKALGKARSLYPHSPLADAMTCANKALVRRLERYRSALIHHLRDEINGGIRRDLLKGQSELVIPVPTWFTSEIRLEGVDEETPIIDAAAAVVSLAGEAAHSVLEALADHIAGQEYSEEEPPNARAMVGRWIRSDILTRIENTDALQKEGLVGCGAVVTGGEFALIVSLEDGSSVETSPILVQPLFAAGCPSGVEIESLLRRGALEAIQKQRAS